MATQAQIAVIGSGPGGYIAALKAAQMGAKTVLIEKGKVGGTCLNRGCIPTKAFLAGAELLHDIRHRGPAMGLKVEGEASVDWGKLLKRKEAILDEQRKGLEFLFKKRDITVLEGTGSFLAPGRIAVENNGKTEEVEAEKVIIATGSRPFRIPGWPEGEKVVTSDEALDWTELPKSLLVVGGGVIGCEFACMLAEFGVKVTIVEMLPQLITGMDQELAKGLLDVFEKRGLRVFLDTKVEQLDEKKKTVEATLSNGETIRVDKVLVSTGRRPNTEDLGLDKLGIETERGFIPVNDKLETTVPGHYAIGDVNGKALLAHTASTMGHLAVENALGADHDYTAPTPWCVYTFPEIAGVGINEVQARERNIPISRGAFPFAASGKAKAYGDDSGFVKVIRNRESGVIVGVHAIGHGATEFISSATVLVHTQATAREVIDMIFAHPTMSEAVREATEVSLFEGLHLPPAKTKRIAL